jgi:hypothetical protein
MSHIPKRKSGDDDGKLIVDLSAIPPQQDSKPAEDPLAGLMPLPRDGSGKRKENPLAGFVSPPPDTASSAQDEHAATADSLTGMLPQQGSSSDDKAAAS